MYLTYYSRLYLIFILAFGDLELLTNDIHNIFNIITHLVAAMDLIRYKLH